MDAFSWHAPHATPPAHLSITGDAVCFQQGETAREVTGDAFLAGDLDGVVLAALGIMALSEARAVLKHRRLPDDRRLPPAETGSLAGRPTINRRIHAAGWRVWFFGRTLAIDVSGKKRVELPLSAVASGGLDAFQGTIDAASRDRVVAAARALTPLPCFCGTGVQRSHEHDALIPLNRSQDPRAPIDHCATVYRCRVCRRWWTLLESGDARYSYHYTVRQLLPDALN